MNIAHNDKNTYQNGEQTCGHAGQMFQDLPKNNLDGETYA